MHEVLRQQLLESGLDTEAFNSEDTLKRLLQRVSEQYALHDTTQASLRSALKSSVAQMQRSMDETQNCMYALVDAIPDLVFVLDEAGRYVQVMGEGKEQNLAVEKEAILGKSPFDLFEPKLAERFNALFVEAQRSGGVHSMRYELEVPSGKKMFEMRMQAFGIEENGGRQVLAIVRDISQQFESEKKSRLLDTVFTEATEGVMIEDEQRKVIYVNPAMETILGMSREACEGKHSTYFSQMLDDKTNQSIYTGMEQRGHWHGEVHLKRFDHTPLLVWLTMDAVFGSDGALSNIVVMATDISEITQTRMQLEHMATHDTLTGLPNRVLLFDRLEHTLAVLSRNEAVGALLFIDLDNFKEINDNYGHSVGDTVLVEIAGRLKASVRSSDTVGRLGGDEYLVILEAVGSADEVVVIINKILDRVAMPIANEEIRIEMSCSIGVALIPVDGDTIEALVSSADRAMYSVKKSGRNGFEFYAKEYSERLHEYFRIQQAIKEALKTSAFEVQYQPQFAIEDGSLSGAEALLRTYFPPLAKVPVAQIISIAEETGLIEEIGRFVLQSVCAQIASWRALSVKPMRIAVNLSRRELASDRLFEDIEQGVRSCCVAPAELEFEITESTLMHSNSRARKNIEALRNLGCRFSIDDYGTGYSSLSNLKEFDLDKLKIDRMFIESITHDDNDQVIVSATISMAKKLGLTVLAEGVENGEQLAILRSYGCDEIQGFLYSEALTADAMTELLRAVNG